MRFEWRWNELRVRTLAGVNGICYVLHVLEEPTQSFA
jgi:hypothetical protein